MNPDERAVTPTADDLWPAPLRPARMDDEHDGWQRNLLWQRRNQLAAEIEGNEQAAKYWNDSHPTEPPIRLDEQLLAVARRIRQLEAQGR